jgi:hypothetical protein
VKRTPEIAVRCPSCGGEAVAGLEGPARCRTCSAERPLALSPSLRDQHVVDVCPACAGRQLYVQRDFNQQVGLGVIVVGAVLAPFTPYYSSLIVAALVDAGLYVLLPEITVCYRCHAHFRGFTRNPAHEPFDLHTAEQYEARSG